MTAARRRPGGARPDGPLLERTQIVDAALRLTQRHGLDGMSMRKLGDELGVTSMAIYWYFNSKDELIDAVTEQVFSMIPVPTEDGRAWEDRLRELCWSVHNVLVDYPGIAGQIYTYQRFPASAIPLIEAGVKLLVEAGFSGREAARSFDVLASVVISRSHFEAYQKLAAGAEGESGRLVVDRVRQGWTRLEQAIDDTAPYARSYVSHLDESRVAAGVFAEALDLLFCGLHARLTERGEPH